MKTGTQICREIELCYPDPRGGSRDDNEIHASLHPTSGSEEVDGVPPSDEEQSAASLRAGWDAEKRQLETRLAEAERHQWDAGFAEAERTHGSRIGDELAKVSALFTTLRVQADDYLNRVERQVIQLVLEIASRVLQHEAQINPLLLAGSVRLALDTLRQGKQAVLRVPEHDIEAWQALLGRMEPREFDLRIEGDARMKAGQCECQVTNSTLDLGIAAQLKEVEYSFSSIARTPPGSIAKEETHNA